jgi:threonine synthase
VYYFYAYFQLKQRLPAGSEPKVSFSVPTGNFGDVLAGYYASEIGLPIHKLLIATNKNDILHRFFQTGCYKKEDGGKVWQTLSPAMDILVSSNFERLLWHLVLKESGDVDTASSSVKQWMYDLKEKGAFTVDSKIVEKGAALFLTCSANDEEVNMRLVILLKFVLIALSSRLRTPLQGTLQLQSKQQFWTHTQPLA